MSRWKNLLMALAMSVCVGTVAEAADVKIGFVIKQPEEPWFQDEWKFADLAAREKGFTLIKIGAEDGEKALAAIDNLGAQGAQGVIICAPDVKLGPGLIARARANQLKLMTVDDQLVNGKGQALEDVPHMGISAARIGEAVGQAIVEQIQARGWNMKEVGAIRVSYDQLPTAKDRVEGTRSVLQRSGFLARNVFDAPQGKTDTEAALNAATAVLNQNPHIKKWVAFGLNDEAVLGAVRATEAVGLKGEDVVGVGIGGSDAAINEFKRPAPTGFFGTVIISPKRHGYETTLSMYDWVTANKPPERLILTSGKLATRDTYVAVRKELGLQ